MFNYGNTFNPDYMEPHAINRLEQNFIHGYYLNEEDMWLCSALSHVSETSLKGAPNTGLPSKELDDPKILEKWGKIVTKITNNYYRIFPEASALGPVEMETPLLHLFEAKTGRGISIEKDRGYLVGPRNLGFITFLNDVETGGSLNWFYQGLKIKPEKGLTIIFPANWSYINTIEPSETNKFNILATWTRFREGTGSRMKIKMPSDFNVDSPVKYDFENNFLDI